MNQIIYYDDGGLYGSRRAIFVKGIGNYSYEQIMMEIQQGKKFISYPYHLWLGFLRVSGMSAIYFVNSAREKRLIWLISVMVTLGPLLLFVIADCYIITNIAKITIDIPSIFMFLICLLGTLLPLRTAIILIKNGGVDLTDEVINLINDEFAKNSESLK